MAHTMYLSKLSQCHHHTDILVVLFYSSGYFYCQKTADYTLPPLSTFLPSCFPGYKKYHIDIRFVSAIRSLHPHLFRYTSSFQVYIGSALKNILLQQSRHQLAGSYRNRRCPGTFQDQHNSKLLSRNGEEIHASERSPENRRKALFNWKSQFVRKSVRRGSVEKQ